MEGETTTKRDQLHSQESRVHFNTDQLSSDHELGIVIQQKADDLLEVHLGFLKVHHHYSVQFLIKDDLGEDVIADPLQNLHCRVTQIEPSEDGEGHTLTIDFHAHKEKLMNENLVISSLDETRKLTLKLMARVLGKHKGTPMLKNGIKCTGMDAEDESEQSDWAGFN